MKSANGKSKDLTCDGRSVQDDLQNQYTKSIGNRIMGPVDNDQTVKRKEIGERKKSSTPSCR